MTCHLYINHWMYKVNIIYHQYVVWSACADQPVFSPGHFYCGLGENPEFMLSVDLDYLHVYGGTLISEWGLGVGVWAWIISMVALLPGFGEVDHTPLSKSGAKGAWF